MYINVEKNEHCELWILLFKNHRENNVAKLYETD